MFPEIVHVTSKQSRTLLTWTHYRELLRVEDSKVRAWYEREVAEYFFYNIKKYTIILLYVGDL